MKPYESRVAFPARPESREPRTRNLTGRPTPAGPPVRPPERITTDGGLTDSVGAPERDPRRAARTRVLPRLLLFFSAGLAPAACGPAPVRPAPRVPAAWVGGSGDAGDPAVLASWWTLFDDPALSGLVGRAVAGNLDVTSAAARLEAARADFEGTVAGLFPTVNGAVDVSRRRLGNSSGVMNGAVNGGTAATPAAAVPAARSPVVDLFQAGFDARWELDVFGARRAAARAAARTAEAAAEDLRDVTLSLVAEVARRYFETTAGLARLAVIRRNLEAQERAAAMATERSDAGFASGLDVARSRSLVATTRAEVPTVETAVARTSYRLDVLLGLPPGTLGSEPDVFASSRAPGGRPPEIPLGVPADLVRRRPDVRRAAALLAAATETTAASYADLFPRFSLTSTYGTAARERRNLGDTGSRFWSFIPGLRFPVFDAGLLVSRVRANRADETAAAAAFEQSVLLAFEEAEASVVAARNERQRFVELSEAVRRNRRAVELATELYRNGLADFVRVTDAQQALFQSEDARVRSALDASLATVTLVKALGGGWRAAAGV